MTDLPHLFFVAAVPGLHDCHRGHDSCNHGAVLLVRHKCRLVLVNIMLISFAHRMLAMRGPCIICDLLDMHVFDIACHTELAWLFHA